MSKHEVPTHGWQSRDGALLIGTAVVTLLVVGTTDLFGDLVTWVHAQSTPDLEEGLVALALTALVGFVLLLRKERALQRSMQDQANTKAKLEERESRYRTLLAHLPVGTYRTLPDGTICEANPAAAHLFGFDDVATLLQHNARDLYADAAERDANVEYARDGEPRAATVRLRHRDGHYLLVRDHVRPVHDAQGRIRYFDGVLLDVTERERYEQQLRVARDEAEEMSRLKSTFLANMSHEVRTPLTGIIGFATVLEEELQGEEHREVAALVRESGRRLLETLNSVLDFARMEAGAIEPNTHRLDLVHEVCEAAVLYRSMAERDGLTFDLDVPAREIGVEVDPTHLRRILANLFSNAVKFTDQGGVTVRLEADDHEAYLHVRDTGSGIDEDFLPHLFQEFRQESSGLSRDYPGSGLGLAIARRLAEHMAGRIEVQSTKGEGSTFTITLPLAPAAVQTETAG